MRKECDFYYCEPKRYSIKPDGIRGLADVRAGPRSMRTHAACVALIVAGCSRDEPTVHAPPVINSTQVVSVSTNVLSAVVDASVTDADSVVVHYLPPDASPASFSATPFVDAESGVVSVLVLGLLPGTEYEFRVLAYGPGGMIAGEAVTLVTGSLPADLPAFTASGSDPSPGYVVFGAGSYGLVIDNTGRVVWYHRFPNGPGLNFMAQPNGRYVARPSTPDPLDYETFVEVNPAGVQTRALGCANGLSPRLHDLLAAPDGTYWVLCDDVRTMNLTSFGGLASAQVTGTAVERLGPLGELLFHWTPFDHFSIADLDPALRSGAVVNWTHGNAIDIDTDGNILLSFRSLNEVTKINSSSGQVIWRLGGIANQYTFTSGSAPFAGQHSVRVLSTNEFIILDNTGASESRAERWLVDPVNRTARITSSYGSTPPVLTMVAGSTQPLPNGRTLVSFGTQGRVEEYDAQGVVRWRIDTGAGFVFRAQRINSLYNPGLRLSR